MKSYKKTRISESMGRIVLSIAMAICVGFPVFAQESKDLYPRVAQSVVYLRHELYLSPDKVKNPELWNRLEQQIHTKLLATYFPVCTGSGFFVDDHGRILTNRHVASIDSVQLLRESACGYLTEAIADNASLYSSQERETLKADLVSLFKDNEYRFAAMLGGSYLGPVNVLAVSPMNEPDLALAEIPNYKSTPLVLAEESSVGSSLVGLDVLSFGYPLGSTMDRAFKESAVTMNRGNISAFRSSDMLDIQHSAAISGGNSGGPLVGMDGKVVGLNTAAYDSSVGNSLFYAVSALKARQFLTVNGYEKILLWNSRYAKMFETSSTGLSLNSSGELESPQILVVSVPSSTLVSLDGKKIGAGQQTLTLASPLSSISLTGPDGIRTYSVRLVPSMRSPGMFTPVVNQSLSPVTFTSDPPGATVIVDSLPLGVTPLTVSLPPDSYEVRFYQDQLAFPDKKISVHAAQNQIVKVTGSRSYPVFVNGIAPNGDTVFVFRNGDTEYSRLYSDGLWIPAGRYDLEVQNFVGIQDTKIPVTVVAGATELNLSPYCRSASLAIRGLSSGSTVWIDGVKQDLSLTGPLMLPIGTHTVAVWKQGLQPLMPTKIAVLDSDDAFVTFKKTAGYDRKRTQYMVTGIVLAAVGVVSGGFATYANISSMPVTMTNSYSDYRKWSSFANYAQIGGATLVASSIIPFIFAGRSQHAFRAQMEELNK